VRLDLEDRLRAVTFDFRELDLRAVALLFFCEDRELAFFDLLPRPAGAANEREITSVTIRTADSPLSMGSLAAFFI
jgi:hypothetical protein